MAWRQRIEEDVQQTRVTQYKNDTHDTNKYNVLDTCTVYTLRTRDHDDGARNCPVIYSRIWWFLSSVMIIDHPSVSLYPHSCTSKERTERKLSGRKERAAWLKVLLFSPNTRKIFKKSKRQDGISRTGSSVRIYKHTHFLLLRSFMMNTFHERRRRRVWGKSSFW